MYVVRAIKPTDLDDLYALALEVGTGMTTLPPDREVLSARIHESACGFGANVAAPGGETYFMVLEHVSTGKVVGCTAIYAGVGLTKPFWSYKVSTIVHSSPELNVMNRLHVLNLVNDFTGAIEVGTLFLSAQHRLPFLGQLLARIRYMLMAIAPKRFEGRVLAEMRGWLDETGTSPFWEHMGARFFGLGFSQADWLSGQENNRFIADLMPRFPVYVELLPEAVQKVVGKPHRHSIPALRMLEKEGFMVGDYVDIFDGGPSVHAHMHSIRTVKQSQVYPVVGIEALAGHDEHFILCTCDVQDFKGAVGPAKIVHDGLVLDQTVAHNLNVSVGQMLRVIGVDQKAKPGAPL